LITNWKELLKWCGCFLSLGSSIAWQCYNHSSWCWFLGRLYNMNESIMVCRHTTHDELKTCPHLQSQVLKLGGDSLYPLIPGRYHGKKIDKILHLTFSCFVYSQIWLNHFMDRWSPLQLHHKTAWDCRHAWLDAILGFKLPWVMLIWHLLIFNEPVY
jgi:hypothetical protein